MSTPVIIERLLNAPVAKVWKAMTNYEQMKQWYFDLPGFKAELGYEFQFLGGTDAHQYLHLCKITEVVPERKLAYTWRYDKEQGESLVSFELFPEGDQTRIVLTHSGLETFSPNNPDFAANNFLQGWTDIIGRSLKEFVENN